MITWCRAFIFFEWVVFIGDYGSLWLVEDVSGSFGGHEVGLTVEGGKGVEPSI